MFKIEITEITEAKVARGQDWVKLFDLSPAQEKMNVENYGYRAPSDEKTERRVRSVLVQEVASLDLVAVIKAVNGIEDAGNVRK